MEHRDTETERDPEARREHESQRGVTSEPPVPPVPPVPVQSSSVVSTVNPGLRAMDLIYLVFGVIDGLLIIRLALKVLGANSAAPFTQWVYNVTDFFLAPFKNLLPTVGNNSSVLEMSILIAILVYALIAWVLARLMAIIFYRNVTYSRRGFF